MRSVGALASGGVRLNWRELLFGEAREVAGEILLLFDWGGEEKVRSLAGHSKSAEGLRIGILSDVLNRWLA